MRLLIKMLAEEIPRSRFGLGQGARGNHRFGRKGPKGLRYEGSTANWTNHTNDMAEVF
jgi:hypothetical protein